MSDWEGKARGQLAEYAEFLRTGKLPPHVRDLLDVSQSRKMLIKQVWQLRKGLAKQEAALQKMLKIKIPDDKAVKALRGKLSDLKDDLETSQKACNAAASKMCGSQADVVDLKKQIKTVSKHLQDLKSKSAVEQYKRFFRKKIDDLKKSIVETRKDVDDVLKKLDSHAKEIRKLQQLIAKQQK